MADRHIVVAYRYFGWVRVSAVSYETRLAAENALDLFGAGSRVVPDHPRWWV